MGFDGKKSDLSPRHGFAGSSSRKLDETQVFLAEMAVFDESEDEDVDADDFAPEDERRRPLDFG